MLSSYPLERVRWLLGAVLNFFAGFLHVLAKAVGSVAPDPDNSQEGGDEQQNNDALNSGDHFCVSIAIIHLLIGLAGGGPLFVTQPQAVEV